MILTESQFKDLMEDYIRDLIIKNDRNRVLAESLMQKRPELEDGLFGLGTKKFQDG